MTTTRIYKSTDTSAPVLTGAVSALINVLDKCLVSGYGSKTAAGWTMPFTGTNKAAFRNSVAAGGTGMYLRVSDAGGGTGGAREALCRCYLTMSDVDTGTIETPTVAQLAASIAWRKSNTADSTARAWTLVADELTFYLCVETGTNTYGAGFYGAGDFASEVAGDAYRYFIFGRKAGAGADSNGSSAGLFVMSNNFATPTADAYFVARGYAGTGNPIQGGTPMLAYTSGTPGSGGGSIASPSPGGGHGYWIQAYVANESTLRGTLRGVHMPVTSLQGIASGTQYNDAPGRPSGSVLTVMRHNCSGNDVSIASNDGHAAVESALAW